MPKVQVNNMQFHFSACKEHLTQLKVFYRAQRTSIRMTRLTMRLNQTMCGCREMRLSQPDITDLPLHPLTCIPANMKAESSDCLTNGDT